MKHRSLARNALLNMVRQSGAILYPLVTFPYISRILGATNYGRYSFSNSIVSYFILIAALGIVDYAIREGSAIRTDANKVSKFANEVFTINVWTMLIAYVLLIALTIFWAKLHAYVMLILVQSIAIFFNTMGVEWVYSIFEDYAYITFRSLLVQAVAIILMFTFVKTTNDYVIYAITTVLASAGGNAIGFFYARKYVHLRLVVHTNLKKHIKPMLILFSNVLAVNVYVNSDITLLGIMRTNREVGYYNVASRVYSLFKQLLNAMVVVLLPRASYYLNNGKKKEYSRMINRALAVIVILSIPLTVGVWNLSNEVIMIIAGREYISSAGALRILGLAIPFSLVASLITTGILLPHRLEKKILQATVFGAVINFVLNVPVIKFWGYNGAALTTFVAEILVCLLSAYFARKIFNFAFILKWVLLAVVGSVSVWIICWGTKQIFTNAFIILMISSVLSIIAYCIVELALFSLIKIIKSHL